MDNATLSEFCQAHPRSTTTPKTRAERLPDPRCIFFFQPIAGTSLLTMSVLSVV